MVLRKINPVKTEVNNEDIKTEQNVNTNQVYRGWEDLQNNTKTIYFAKQENKFKPDHHEDIGKIVIQELKKLDMLYNPASLNYIN